MIAAYLVSFFATGLCAFAFANAETFPRKFVCGLAWLIVILALLIFFESVFIAAITNMALLQILGTACGLVVGSLFRKG